MSNFLGAVQNVGALEGTTKNAHTQVSEELYKIIIDF